MTTTAVRGAARAGAVGRPGTAISARSLHKFFGRVEAVRDVDLDIDRGEIVAFLGPNGAGKTSTIDMVLGLSQPTSGTVSVFGTDPHDAISRGLVAAVMQTGGLLRDVSVRESVQYVAATFHSARPVDEILESAGLVEIADRKVAKCSGGEQQRLRFAMALVSDPELIILDEPTTGMDVNARRAFWESIRADAAKGRTVVFATHYLEEADAYADRIILIRAGEIVADGTAAQIRALGAGRTVRITWPGVTDAALAQLPRSDRDQVEVRGEQVVIHTSSSDEVARWLLNHPEAHDLEVESRGIEDAFVALTASTTTTAEEATR